MLESQGLTLGPITLLLDDGPLDVLFYIISFVMVHFSSSGFGNGIMARVCTSIGGTLVFV